MPFPGLPAGPLLTAGAGSAIPISAGGGSTGPVSTNFGPVNLGGVFGSGASSANPYLVPAIVGGAILLAVILAKRR